MIERVRALLDRPLEPAVARAVLLLALAAGVGFALVAVLAGVDHATTTRTVAGRSRSLGNQRSRIPASGLGLGLGAVPTQDPQDRPGSAAHRRAVAELAGHRALQHVPFEGDGVSIDIVGARGGRAVLRVRGATKVAASRGWQAFLRRYRDPGRAYVPIFEGNRRRRGS